MSTDNVNRIQIPLINNANSANNDLENEESEESVTNTEKYTLNFLSSLIPKTFSGKRSELNTFLINCNAAMNLAKVEQHVPLLYVIMSKIEDPAKSQLTNFTFQNWEQLKEKLTLLYQDKKHYVQLFEELNNLRQNKGENITQYHRRIEECEAKVLASLNQTITDPTLIPGSIANINQIALSRFIFHCSPNLSTFLRWRGFTNLNEALSAAIQEEQVLNLKGNNFGNYQRNQNSNFGYQNRNQNSRSQKYCTHCPNLSNHSTHECFKNKNKPFEKKVFNIKTCSYCHRDGHEISNCYKRQNSRNNSNKSEASHSNSNEKKNFNQGGNSKKYCSNCRMSNHNTADCRRKPEGETKNQKSLNSNSLPVANTEPERIGQINEVFSN